MSLRKSPTLTPALLKANRRNARLSTGPATAATKQNSRRNSLQHGLYARDGGAPRAALEDLGENAQDFDRLYRQLLAAYQPDDPLWARQVEDLARLYWRRERLERVRNALLVTQREKLREERRRRAMENDRDAYEALDEGVGAAGVWQLPDSEAKFRVMVSHLEALQIMAEMGRFEAGGKMVLRYLYGKYQPWRGANIARAYASLADGQEKDEESAASTRQTLWRELRAELVTARQQLAWWKAQRAEPSPAACDAALAPEGETWRLLLRQERDLDRAIDRKVRILLDLRRYRHLQELDGRAEAAGGSEEESLPGEPQPSEVAS